MKKVMAVILSSFIILSAASCSGNPDSSVISSEASTAVEETTAVEKTDAPVDYQALLDKAVKQYQFEGVAYATKNGEVLFEKAKGMANPETGEEITIDSLFCIGSVSKQFCSTSIMLLREQGKLSVDDTLEKYFPEYEIGKDITIKNLLTMRSGICDASLIALEEVEYIIKEDASSKENRKNILAWLFEQPLVNLPDEKFEYNNCNYLLLSEIIEQITGVTYEEFVSENIFKPLKMENTGFLGELLNSPKLAQYNKELFEASPYPYHLYNGVTQGAGDIISNVKDMDIWMTAVRENTLIAKDVLEEMITDYSPDSEGAYGYGFMPNMNGGIGHAGSIATYESFEFMDFENKCNLIVITNDVDKLFGTVSGFAAKLIDDMKL